MMVVLAVTRREQVQEPVHRVRPVARTRHVRQPVAEAVAGVTGVMVVGPTTVVVHVPETGELAEAMVPAATAATVLVPNKPRVRNRKAVRRAVLLAAVHKPVRQLVAEAVPVGLGVIPVGERVTTLHLVVLPEHTTAILTAATLIPITRRCVTVLSVIPELPSLVVI